MQIGARIFLICGGVIFRSLNSILYRVPMLDGMYTHSDVRICEHTGCGLKLSNTARENLIVYPI